MEALGLGGGSLWSNHNNFYKFLRQRPPKSRKSRNGRNTNQKPSSSISNSNSNSYVEPNTGFRFPVKQALTAASLAFAGDTIAQLRNHWPSNHQDIIQSLLSDHDWIRALRMTSYGFLFYGPGSYVWYQTLDRYLPQPTAKNLLLKVLLNQIILGPAVIAVVFAWNNLWQGKLCELPRKYQKDALPTLLIGFRFWVPYSAINFWVIPLHARVAFMSLGSIFWNFILSSTMSK